MKTYINNKIGSLKGFLQYYKNRVPQKLLSMPVMLKIMRLYTPVFHSPEVQKVIESDFKDSSHPEAKPGIDLLYAFLASKKNNNNIFIFFCPVHYSNIGGQRGVRFSQELALKENIVIFVRVIPNCFNDEVTVWENNIIEMPFNWFFPMYKELLVHPFLINKNKFLVNQLTFEHGIPILDFAKQKDWTLIYDIIDDWEEFYKDGFWPSYKKETEEYFIKKSDIVLSINKGIAEKFSYLKKIIIIPNGYSPRILKKEAQLYNKVTNASISKEKNLIIGTFGFLHIFRFNWELLIKTAKKKKNWTFQIIGWGEPPFLILPENIQLLGKVQPEDLYKHAANWDVAIIPYRNNSLCKKLNPIKIFEFLYFDLPVVIFGQHNLDNFPATYYATGKTDFIKKITLAAKTTFSKEEVFVFLKDATWESRVFHLLAETEKYKIANSEKLLYASDF